VDAIRDNRPCFGIGFSTHSAQSKNFSHCLRFWNVRAEAQTAENVPTGIFARPPRAPATAENLIICFQGKGRTANSNLPVAKKNSLLLSFTLTSPHWFLPSRSVATLWRLCFGFGVPTRDDCEPYRHRFYGEPGTADLECQAQPFGPNHDLAKPAEKDSPDRLLRRRNCRHRSESLRT